MKKELAENVDDYIAGFPKEVQKLLKEIRASIKKAAPTSKEAIKYGIPTFVLNGNMVSFAGYKNHIGFYPAPTSDPAFTKALAPYASSKSTARFPLDKPLPISLISRMVKHRIKQLNHRAKVRASK